MIGWILSILTIGTWLNSPATSMTAGTAPDLTVSYSISISSKKGGDMGIAETYNGGVETLFVGKDHARLRLVSLMRIQSIYVSLDGGIPGVFTIVKESGKNKNVTRLSRQEWKAYNSKYDGAAYELTEDTMQVLHHLCKKAIVTLKGGRVITAWYTTDIGASVFSFLEPAFSGVPGLVLKFEYTYKKKTISYTATSISRQPISDDALAIPSANDPAKS